MELHISYKAINTYQEQVSEAIYEFILLPALSQQQITYGLTLENSLQKAAFKYKNIFGFEVIRIRTTEPFKEMIVSMNAYVYTKASNPFDFTPPLRMLTDRVTLELDYYIEHHIFLKGTNYTSLPSAVVKEFIVWEPMEGIFEFLLRMNAAVHEYFVYEKGVTDVNTSAFNFYTIKAGVCQDYAHFFIALCRAYKIPARYVSGYLNEDADFLGASMMHAWVEAHIPHVGWVGIDPTNKVLTNHNYVKVAHGADYKDCSPIKGILFTNGANTTNYEVSVRQSQQ